MDTQHAQRARDHAERGTAGATAFAILDLADAIRSAGSPATVLVGPVPTPMSMIEALEKAREIAVDYAECDGEHHKQHALVTIAELLGGHVPDHIERGIPA